MSDHGDAASEDRRQVERVLAGDADAFENIVRRWQGPLINLAYRFCRDRGRAEDMAQEAFLRAYRGLGAWRKDGAFSTWLFAVATNLYRSELRRIPSRVIPLDEAAELRDLRDDERLMDDSARDDAVQRAVRVLPSKYREALILYYFHGMDLAAAARSLGLPEGTVKARLFRGRAILRDKLEHLVSPARELI